MIENIISPTVLDSCLFTEAECSDILHKVHSLHNCWEKKLRSYYHLPAGLYACDFDSYSSAVIKHRALMRSTFGDYHDRLVSSLTKALQLEIHYHHRVHYPGFHISAENTHTTNFHTDSFGFLHNLLADHTSSQFDPNLPNHLKHRAMQKYTILSVLVPIATPQAGAGLLYKHNNQVCNFAYTVGALTVWPGMLPHSMKPFVPVSDTDIRVTMQCHLAITRRGPAYLFW